MTARKRQPPQLQKKKIRNINLSIEGEHLAHSGGSDFTARAPAFNKGTPTSAMRASEDASNCPGTLAAMFAMGAEAPHLILPTPLPTPASCYDLYEEFFDVQQRLNP